MCGRITLSSSGRELAEKFDLEQEVELAPRYNIAPTQDVAIIRAEAGQRTLSFARWGLIPGWAKDPSIGNRMINARCETVGTKGAFKKALRARRCIVPVSGFYEWAGEGKQRQPYLFGAADGAPFGIAGLWDHWRPAADPQASTVTSCVLITTEANAALRPIHDRMPVILSPRDHARWLDPEARDPEEAASLLVPCPPGWLDATPVSTYVNNPRNEGARCIEPTAP